MNDLFRFPAAVRQDPSVNLWLRSRAPELGALAGAWFQRMRQCGRDVREVMHDGCPTACVDDAAFGYVGVYRAHVNVGFFRGAELADPRGLLEGTGKRMPARQGQARCRSRFCGSGYPNRYGIRGHEGAAGRGARERV
jgi:hypothetical protein